MVMKSQNYCIVFVDHIRIADAPTLMPSSALPRELAKLETRATLVNAALMRFPDLRTYS
jgi:hypothetical protein